MNKNNLYKNFDTKVNVSSLRNSMVGLRVLILDAPADAKSVDLPRFFDVIIVTSMAAAEYVGRPDIIINSRTSPYEGGLLDLVRYDSFKDSIWCITIDEIQELGRANKRLQNYILPWHPTTLRASSDVYSIASIAYGLSATESGLHLAMLGGSQEIYIAADVERIIKHKTGYRYTYMRSNKRNVFLETAQWNSNV